MSKNYDIFISYRRKGGYDTAKHLYDRLSSDGYSVSFDIDTLRSGDFDSSLVDRIKECKDFVLIMNKELFNRLYEAEKDENGEAKKDRDGYYILKSPLTPKPDEKLKEDWVYNEIALALEFKKNIVPITLDGFTYPSVLPNAIADILRKNSLEHSQKYFEALYGKLTGTFLVSKKAFGVRYKKPIIAGLLFALLIVIGSVSYVSYRNSEVQKAEFQAAVEEANKNAESAIAAAQAEAKRKHDSVEALVATAKQAEQKTVAVQQTKSEGKVSAPAASNKKPQLYWAAGNSEIATTIKEKLQEGVKINSGKCDGNNFKLQLDKASTSSSSAAGQIKIAYSSGLRLIHCEDGKTVETFSWPDKEVFVFQRKLSDDEVNQKIIDMLKGKSFSAWIEKLKQSLDK